MLHLGRSVAHFQVGEGVGAALVAEQQRIALRIVARAAGRFQNLDAAAIGVLPVSGRDALADDGGSGVLPDVDHLGAGVGLLPVVGEGHRVELADGIVTDQQAAGIFPGNGGAGFDLGPGDLGIDAAAGAALGDEIVDAALAVLIAGVPVLDGGILDLGVIQGDELDYGGVQLVGVAHRRGAAFQVAHGGAFVGDDQGALKLPGILGVDAEVGGQLHGALDALGDVAEAAIAEDGRIQRSEEIVAGGDDRTEILADEIGMLFHGLGEGPEDDADFVQLRLEGGGDGHAIEHGIDRDTGEHGLFLQGNAKLGVGLEQFGVDVVQALRPIALGFGRRIINDVLVVDFGVVDVGPLGLFQGEPVAIGFQTPVEQPFGLLLLGGNQTDDIFAQAAGDGVGFYVRDKAPLVLLIRKCFDRVGGFAHLDVLLTCWLVFIFANLYFIVKISHLMDAVGGRTAHKRARNAPEAGLGSIWFAGFGSKL